MNKSVHRFFSFHSNSVFYRLTMAFALFFMAPLLGLLFLSTKTDLFGTNELLYCLAGLLISALFGYMIMRQISRGVSRVEERMAEKIEGLDQTRKTSEDELTNIQRFADMLSNSMQTADVSLSKRINELSALADLRNASSDNVNIHSFLQQSIQKGMEVAKITSGALLYYSSDSSSVKFIRTGGGIRRDLTRSQEVKELLSDGVSHSIFLSGEEIQEFHYIFTELPCNAALLSLGWLDGKYLLLVVSSENSDGWDQTTIEFLSTYFQNLAHTLKMRELSFQSREVSNELETVSAIIRYLISGKLDSEIFPQIAQLAEEMSTFDWLGLGQIDDENSSEISIIHSLRSALPESEKHRIPLSQPSLFKNAGRNSDVLAVDDISDDERFAEHTIFQANGLGNCLVIGLKSGNRDLGALYIGKFEETEFREKEKYVFSILGMGVSLYLQQHRMFAEERAKRRELEIFNNIASALSSQTINVKKIMPYVLHQVEELIQFDSGVVMLLSFDELKVEAAHGAFKKELLKQKFSLNHGVAGYVVATGEPVDLGDVKETPHFLSIIDEKTGFETRSLLCVPLISGGRVTGVIELLRSKKQPFAESDLKILKTVASSTAMAIETSRLYEESNHIAKKERFIRKIFQQYVPEKIVSDILERGKTDHLTRGEKRIVTVFNVDIRGYSYMSKQATTEDVFDILNHFFKRMGTIVLEHNGVLDKYLGDGLMAIFGVDESSSNPALDAVQAALEMIRVVDSISMLAIDRCGLPVRIGISINTGEAIVGNIGFDKKVEYTVIGDVVNETFRLQDLTKKKLNSILISQSTKDQIAGECSTIPYGLRKIGETVMNVYEVQMTDDGIAQLPDTEFEDDFQSKIH